MGHYVALLRGINVSGHRRLPMKKLITIFEEHGCRDVRTYIQSGNVVFEAKAALAKRIPKLVHASVEKEFDYDVPVVVRSAAELKKALAAHPFAKGEANDKALHVAFLSAEPTAKAVAAIDEKRSPGDRFAVKGREVHLHLPKGVGKTKLDNAYLERTLAVKSTMRNWRTCQKLLEMAS
jgi:uncharacterized protein (DUF1697 family)